MTIDIETKTRMDNMYRWTRHIYDASRKYYLLGRDKLIENMNAQKGETVCMVGCGTARNMIKMIRRYPEAFFVGLDASDEMLKTARQNLKKQGLLERTQVQQGFAQTFSPETLFGLEKPLDKIAFSYSLSIIPPWRDSIDHALNLLESGGEIHIVDFGAQEDLPRWFRALLFWWLKLFHVYYKPDILEHLKTMERDGKGTLDLTTLYGGYAYLAVFKKA